GGRSAAAAARRAGGRADGGRGGAPRRGIAAAQSRRRCDPRGRAQHRLHRHHRRRSGGDGQWPADRARQARTGHRRSQGSGGLFRSPRVTAVMRISNLAGGYGRLTVFRDVSLELARGQTIGLLGANGAGKTTLMKTIAGALPASSGTVLLNGRDLSRLAAY